MLLGCVVLLGDVVRPGGVVLLLGGVVLVFGGVVLVLLGCVEVAGGVVLLGGPEVVGDVVPVDGSDVVEGVIGVVPLVGGPGGVEFGGQGHQHGDGCHGGRVLQSDGYQGRGNPQPGCCHHHGHSGGVLALVGLLGVGVDVGGAGSGGRTSQGYQSRTVAVSLSRLDPKVAVTGIVTSRKFGP